MSETFNLPVTQFMRPLGDKREGHILVPGDVEEKYKVLKEYGINITMEAIGGGEVNVCLDDGYFDYKFELWKNDGELTKKIADLVRNFDPEDYEIKSMEHDDEEGEWSEEDR